MDILDQALAERERELYRKLASISDPQIQQLLADITHIKRTKEIVSGIHVEVSVVAESNNGDATSTLTQGDATVQILSKSGRPLHVSELLKELPNYGINTTRQNLVGVLMKDRRRRFINKGGNTFELNKNASENGHSKPLPPRQESLLTNTSQAKRSALPKGFSLTESIKALLPELKGEFSQPVIYDILTKRYPDAAPHIQRASIATTLSKIAERGLIEVTDKGYGSEPRRYKRKH